MIVKRRKNHYWNLRQKKRNKRSKGITKKDNNIKEKSGTEQPLCRTEQTAPTESLLFGSVSCTWFLMWLHKKSRVHWGPEILLARKLAPRGKSNDSKNSCWRKLGLTLKYEVVLHHAETAFLVGKSLVEITAAYAAHHHRIRHCV